MFKTALLPSTPARLGLNWAVVRVDYAGNKSNYAYCKTQSAASKVADALNAMTTVAVPDDE